MFKLNEPFRDFIAFKEKEYAIDLSFDNVLEVLEVWNEETLEPELKLITSCSLLFGEDIIEQLIFEDLISIFELVRAEVFHGDELTEVYDQLGNVMKKKEEKPDFSLEYDSEYIFTSFIQAYGINLQKEFGEMHWEEFRMLLRDLPPDSKLNRVREIRNWKPSKNSTSEEIEQMRELQEIYALPDSEMEGGED